MAEREDAARREAIAEMFAPRDLNEPPEYEPEPEPDGLAPPEKPTADYTDEERAAWYANVDRVVRERARREEHREREAAARAEAEANRTDAQRHGDAISEALSGGKGDSAAELVRSMHPGEER